MDDAKAEEWLDMNQKICLCLGISKKKFLDEMKGGCPSIEQINKKLGSSRGSCGGKRCQPQLRKLLREYKEWGQS